MNWNVIITLIGLTLGFIFDCHAQDPPSGYTNNYRLRMWDEGDHPGADSVNKNVMDIDLQIFKRNQRIDSLKTAFSWMFNFPSGTWKRYNSAEFDDDTLKVKAGVFPKLSTNNSYTGLNSFANPQTDFGNGGSILNFDLLNDEGEIDFRKNGTEDLLVYYDDGNYWDFKKPVTINGEPIGTSTFTIDRDSLDYLAKRQTITKKKIFNDTLQATSIVDLESVTINNYLKLNADIISDLIFVKGANTWIQTADNFALFLGVNNDTAIKISTNNGVRFYEDVDVDGQITTDGIIANTIQNLAGDSYLNSVYSGNNYITGNTDAQDISATFLKQGVDATYVATKIIKGKLASTTATYTNLAHGLNWRQIISQRFIIREDSLHRDISTGYSGTTGTSTGSVAYVDSLYCSYYQPAASVNLVSDSIFWYITYHK